MTCSSKIKIMKTVEMYFGILLFISLNTVAFCQEKDKTANKLLTYRAADPHSFDEPNDWPANLDAVIAAPKNHKIIMENNEVRVLEVSLLPGELEPIHHHKWPSVLYIMEAGDFIDYDTEGNIIMDTRQIKPALQFPLTMWKDSEAPHAVKNLSSTVTIKLIRVEIKK